MRVPIENGLGFFNQVSDFIKLSAAYRFFSFALSYFEFSGGSFFIAAENPVHISAS